MLISIPCMRGTYVFLGRPKRSTTYHRYFWPLSSAIGRKTTKNGTSVLVTWSLSFGTTRRIASEHLSVEQQLERSFKPSASTTSGNG